MDWKRAFLGRKKLWRRGADVAKVDNRVWRERGSDIAVLIRDELVSEPLVIARGCSSGEE